MRKAFMGSSPVRPARPAKSVSFPARRSCSVCLHRRRGLPAGRRAGSLVNPERHDIAPTAARLRRSRRDGSADGVAPRRRRPRDHAVRRRARPAPTTSPRRSPARSAARTPAELAARSEIVVTMVPNGAVVQSLVDGADGLLQGLRPGTLLLDTSSSEPWLTEATGATPRGRRRGDGRRAGLGRASGAPRRPSSSSCAAAPRPTSSASGRCSRSWARRCSTSARSAPATR